jgi:hypothetical protein
MGFCEIANEQFYFFQNERSERDGVQLFSRQPVDAEGIIAATFQSV